MSRSIYRTLLIWAIIVVAIVNIYPTLGWLIVLDEPAREARIAKWKAEDDERAKERQSGWNNFIHGIKRWVEFDNDRVINLGLDLQGGIHMVFGFDINNLPPEKLEQYRKMEMTDAQITQQVQDTVLNQIRRRVADFEADEPVIQALGTNQIQVQLPGEKDIDRARDLMTKVAELNFHIADDPAVSAQTISTIAAAMPEDLAPFLIKPMRGAPYQFTVDNYDRVRAAFEKAAQDKLIPEDKIIRFSQRPKPYEEQRYEIYVLAKTPLARGENLASASAIPDTQNSPFWMILFSMESSAATDFGVATQANIDNAMAIVVDDVVLSAPTIRARISDSGSISGNFEDIEARDLAIALDSGSMVVKVSEDFTRVVGASLGADAVRAGYTSAAVALLVVGIFMIIYYLAAGFIALIVLALNSILVVAAMAYFDLTLTMPGIAGLILTIAVAVDGNILIYERIREELRQGHSLLSSVESAFERVGITILDANITNLIAAAILFQFGTGPLEGFSIALAIGICVGVFTSLIVTHALLDFFVDRKLITDLKMFSLIPAVTKIRFMEAYRLCLIGSAVILVVGIAFFGIRGSSMFGVDFREGTNLRITIDADAPVPVNSVREALAVANFNSPVVQESGDGSTFGNEFMIRVSEVGASDEASAPEPTAEGAAVTTVGERIQAALASLGKAGAPTGIVIVDQQTVGPAVGAQLRSDAIKALISALFFVYVFLWWRFDWRFAAGAVVAVFHDVILTAGILAIMNVPITMNVVAGLLTIIGYSLNDTIVVFDRVREDMRLMRSRGISFFNTLNLAINATLARTLLTGTISLFVLIVLFIFGGDAINDFALTLIIGMIVGTYSSIYIASPIVHLLREYKKPANTELAAEDAPAPRRKKQRKAKTTSAAA